MLPGVCAPVLISLAPVQVRFDSILRLRHQPNNIMFHHHYRHHDISSYIEYLRIIDAMIERLSVPKPTEPEWIKEPDSSCHFFKHSYVPPFLASLAPQARPVFPLPSPSSLCTTFLALRMRPLPRQTVLGPASHHTFTGGLASYQF